MTLFPMDRSGRAFLPSAFSILAFAVFAFVSCAGAPKDGGNAPPAVPSSAPGAPGWIWDSRPEEGTLVFVAAGGRRGNRTEEAASALADAAMQAGVFSGFWGASQDFVTSDAGGTGWHDRTRALYDGPAEDRALAVLEAAESWRDREATWIRFRMPGPPLPPFSWEPTYRSDGPDWRFVIPDIPGWRTAVGIGGVRSTMAKTLRAADEAALAEMVGQIHGANRTVTASSETSTLTWSESSGSTASYGSGFGSVRGFLIVARWLDEEGNGWSLAVCPEEWNQSAGR